MISGGGVGGSGGVGGGERLGVGVKKNFENFLKKKISFFF